MSGRYANKRKRTMRRENARDVIRQQMLMFADFINGKYESTKPDSIHEPLTFSNYYNLKNGKSRVRTSE